MTNELYDSPQSDLESKRSAIPTEVKKPWYVYLMVIWSFFGIGSFLSTVARSVASQNQQLSQVASLGTIVFTIVLVIYVFKMHRIFLIIFGVLSASLAVWQTINALGILLSDNPSNPIIYFMFYYILPSVLLAIAALRPKLLNLAVDYRLYKNHEAMRKASLKAMKR